MDYQEIKRLAKERGESVRDLIALAPQNDPFYTGSKGELAEARWFAKLWQRFGYGRGVHLRRIHYQIVSQDPPVAKPNGTVYENTENDWNYVNSAAKYARYLRLVPVEHFVDRRNPGAVINTKWTKPGDSDYRDPTPGWWAGNTDDWQAYQLPGLPTLPDLPEDLPSLPNHGVRGYEGIQQAYHVEVWAEKTTMNDVLIPLCEQYDVNLITGAGELSITAVLDLMNRIRQAERPARILYISDYDPAGLGMPISVARKIEFFQSEFGYDDLAVALHPIVLTADQVQEYSLPRVPVKDSDRRKANWIATQGAGQVELDALEALHPGELAAIVQSEILTYHDPGLDRRAWNQRYALTATLARERRDILEAYEAELAYLRGEYAMLRTGFAETRVRFSELAAQFQAEIDAHREHMDGIRQRGQQLYGKLLDEMREADVDTDDYPLPEPGLEPESGDLLYRSERGYLGQLGYYQAHRNGTNGHDRRN